MENPWSSIGGQGIHRDDRYYADKHNKAVARRHPGQSIRSYLPPLPFIGNPLTARVVLLGKNASFKPKDEEEADRIPALVDENHKAFTFESDFPFFYLDPRFEGTTGYQWWWEALKDVIADCLKRGTDSETVLSRIACVQYHPYRSEESFVPKEPFPTQKYTFHLAREATRDPDRLFILLGGAVNERVWREAVPELPDNCLRLRSAQSVSITARNTKEEDWERLIHRLCAPA